MFSEVDQYVARCINLSTEELDYFHSILQPAKIARKAWFLREGEVSGYEAYVVKGCLRKYCIAEDGSEVVLQFAVEDWWVGDIASFTQQIPSQVYVQALEESELLLISQSDKEQLFKKIPAFERMFRLLVQRSVSVLQERFIATLTKPAAERYEAFLNKYPDIAARVPQHYIASFLGISPEFLSRIRSRKTRRLI